MRLLKRSKFFRRWRGLGPLNQVLSKFDHKCGQPDLLYLGDSVIERVSSHDKDRRTLGEMLIASIEPSVQASVLSGSAYNLRIYYAILRALSVTKNRPKYLLIPINIRSFSPQWHLNPAWQFALELQEFADFLKKRGMFADPDILLSSLSAPSSEIEFALTEAKYFQIGRVKLERFLSLINTVPRDESGVFLRKRTIFEFHYMFQLEDTHEYLLAIREIKKMCNQQGILPVFYVTPINFEAGVRYVGDSFSQRLTENTQHIDKLFNNLEQITYINLTFSQGKSNFFSADEPTEHLNEIGRFTLASRLARSINVLTKG